VDREYPIPGHEKVSDVDERICRGYLRNRTFDARNVSIEAERDSASARPARPKFPEGCRYRPYKPRAHFSSSLGER